MHGVLIALETASCLCTESGIAWRRRRARRTKEEACQICTVPGTFGGFEFGMLAESDRSKLSDYAARAMAKP